MAQPKCPFCLAKHDFNKSLLCQKYGEEVPQIYISEYNQVPPLWLVTVGFSKHGKTTYLAALTMMLQNINRVWPDTTDDFLDSYTFETVKEIRRQAETGEQPESTPKQEVPRAMLIHMYDVPDAGSHCLVLYDTAGETYESLQGDDDQGYLRSLKEVKNIWFLISLKDLEENSDKRISDLFNVYLSGMRRLKWLPAGRNLIVVYTKADKIFNDLPDTVQQYLINDPLQNVTNYDEDVPEMDDFSLDSYVEEMGEISDELERYTRQRIPRGGAFIRLARRHKMGLYFTITSALGADPDGENLLRQDATRYRVLDPYLWALHLNKPESSRPIKLLLDASAESVAVYNYQIGDLAEELADLGEVSTYYLGQTMSISEVGQAPPSGPPTTFRPRLIGPILQASDPNSMVVALATGSIHDLDDYASSKWRDRLLLVSVGQEQHQNWPNMIILRENDEINLISREFRRLFESERVKR